MDKDKIISEMRAIRDLGEKAMNGEDVYCPKCGALLTFYGPNSGKHPGLFCPNGDFKTLLDYKSNSAIEQMRFEK